MKLKGAIIGLWGHEIYAKQLAEHPLVKLIAISAFSGISWERRKKLKDWAKNYKVPFYQNYSEMLEKHNLDVCIVMAPPWKNPAIVKETLSKGIHTISEKPICGNIKDTQLLAQTIRKTKVCYTACFPLSKFSKPFRDAYKYIQEGNLGNILTANFTYLASRGPLYITKEPHYRDSEIPPSSVSGGEAAMFSGYGIIALEWFIGERIEKVYAKAGSYFYPSYKEKNIEDMAHIIIKFPSEVVGSIVVGRTPSPSAPTFIGFDITGTKGNLFYNSKEEKGLITLYSDYTGYTEVTQDPGGIKYYTSNIPGLSQIDDFIEAIIHKREPLINAEDVISTIEVLSAAYRSNALGREIKVKRVWK